MATALQRRGGAAIALEKAQRLSKGCDEIGKEGAESYFAEPRRAGDFLDFVTMPSPDGMLDSSGLAHALGGESGCHRELATGSGAG